VIFIICLVLLGLEFERIKIYKEHVYAYVMLRVNKKGVSLMVGYVLLIALSVVVAGSVYFWLSGYFGQAEVLECSRDISLLVKDVGCDGNVVNLTFKNAGLFNFGGYIIRGGVDASDVSIDLSRFLNDDFGGNVVDGVVFFDGVDDNLFSFRDEAVHQYVFDFPVNVFEVVPVMTEENERGNLVLAKCFNVVKRDIFRCDGISNASLILGEDMNEDVTDLGGDRERVDIKDSDGEVLISINKNKSDDIDLADVAVLQNDPTADSSFILIKNLELPEGETKSVYFDVISGSGKVCVKDEELLSINEISLDCSNVGEVLVDCPGSSGGYSCKYSDDGLSYEVSGLSYSGAREMRASDENPIVFILSGQSNMLGIVEAGNTIPSNLFIVPDNVKYYNVHSWDNELRSYDSLDAQIYINGVPHFGPEISLVHKFAENYPDREIIVIKFAVGGTTIHHWNPDYSEVQSILPGLYPGAGELSHYERLYEKLITNIRSVVGEYPSVEYGGIFWLQGESDAIFGNDNFLALTRDMVENLRSDLGDDDIPFIVGKINPGISSCSWSSWYGTDVSQGISNIRAQQELMRTQIGNTYVIDTKNLSCPGNDIIHFNQHSQVLLGNLFWDGYVQLIDRESEVQPCVDVSWSPSNADICVADSISQISNCGTNRVVAGVNGASSCVSMAGIWNNPNAFNVRNSKVLETPGLSNSVRWVQLPDNKDLFLGREMNGNNKWKLILGKLVESDDKYQMIKQKDIISLPANMPEGGQLTTAFDPSVIKYNGKYWVAFECYRSIAFSPSSDTCMAVLKDDFSVDSSKMYVVVQSEIDFSGDQYSASVPKLFIHNGKPYLYWTAVKFVKDSNGNFQWDSISTRGSELELDSVSGKLWVVGSGKKKIVANSQSLSSKVWGTNAMDDTRNSVADIFSVVSSGGYIYATAAVGGTSKNNCVTPLSDSVGCYRLSIGRATVPLGNDIFSVMDETILNPHEYSNFFWDSEGELKMMGNFIYTDDRNTDISLRINELIDSFIGKKGLDASYSSDRVFRSFAMRIFSFDSSNGSVCDSAHLAPDWGEKNGMCLKSCGQLGGTTAYDSGTCASRGLVDKGVAYDTNVCCGIAPIINCAGSWDLNYGSCSATTCGTSGRYDKLWTTTTPASNGGVACPSPTFVNDGGNACSAPACPVVFSNNAQFVSQFVSSSMVPDQLYTVSVAMKNTGDSTWTKGSNFKLGSHNPQDNSIWKIQRVELSSTEVIRPGQTKIFSFTVKAPASSGSYNFQWMMLQEGVEWFGEKSPNVGVNIAPSCIVSTWTPAITTKCSGTSFTQTSNCGTTRSAVGTKTTGECCTVSSWTPLTTTKCSGVSFTQISNCGTTRSAVGTKTLDECCSVSTWTPATTTKCSGISFIQTSNCGTTRSAVGTKTTGECCSVSTWTPLTTTKCSGVSFTQTSNCGTTRSAVGTKTTGECCTISSWTPATTTKCSGISFIQTSNCGTTRSAVGTKTTDECCSVSSWTPLTTTKCNGVSFTQTSNCGTTRSAVGTKTTGECCSVSTWTPATTTKCSGTSFIQTSNCGTTRSAVGTKTVDECCSVSTWTPLTTTKCNGVSFTQTSNCGTTRSAVGTKTADECCSVSSWTPLTTTKCSGVSFTQTSNCGTTRSAVGTKTVDECCSVSTWTPATTTKCSGTSFIQTSNCGTTRSAVGTKTVDECCSVSTWTPLTTTKCNGVSFTQTSNCGTTRSAVGTKTTGECCSVSSWTPLTTTKCSGVSFTQTSNCGTTRSAVGTKTTGECCSVSTWTPATTTKCSGISFIQTSNCGTTRSAVGTKTTGECCTISSWTPLTTTKCNGVSFTQTSNCGTTRSAVGTKTTGECCSVSSWTPLTTTKCSGVSFTQTSNCGTTRSAVGTKTTDECVITYLAKAGEEILDCSSQTVAPRSWYIEKGRCGDPSGIAYWNGRISAVGISAAKTEFTKMYNDICYLTFGVGGDACNDKLLCNPGDDYIKNTISCKAL